MATNETAMDVPASETISSSDQSVDSKESDTSVNTNSNQLDSEVSEPGPSSPTEESLSEPVVKETVNFKVVFNKQKHDVTFPLDNSIIDLKKHVETITGVPFSMQKIMFKGLAKDEQTLRDLKVTKGSKFMVVGSTLNDVLAVSAKPTPAELKKEEEASSAKEPFCKQKLHKKVLEKYGKPDDAMVGIKKVKEPLPSVPLAGMYNKAGGKVRLTFKMEVDQLWIGTKERTDKIPMGSIKAIVNEPIENHEDYHIMGIQLGPTEASRYWVYWVPAQYTDAIKDAILGHWQLF